MWITPASVIRTGYVGGMCVYVCVWGEFVKEREREAVLGLCVQLTPPSSHVIHCSMKHSLSCPVDHSLLPPHLFIPTIHPARTVVAHTRRASDRGALRSEHVQTI